MAVAEDSPELLALDWLKAFGQAASSGDGGAVADLFSADGWLRDRLALTWDLQTFHGREAIEEVLAARLADAAISGVVIDRFIEPSLEGVEGDAQWVQAAFRFETAVGRCRGFVRLTSSPDSDGWRAWTLLLELVELKGHEEILGARRPPGVEHGQRRQTETWLDRRAAQREFTDDEPAVVIIGAGQSGLALAARLGQLGVDTLVLERHDRVGDGWRKRYRSLVLHDPIHANHLPYLPFPQTWPRFIPKDKLADWFEAYVSILELNLWTASSVADSSWDEASGTWAIRVKRGDGTERVVHPRHVVVATGTSGLPWTPTIAGMDDFQGEMYHSSRHRGGDGMEGKRVLVLGAGNSGHDIAHDMAEAGADITMLQRSRTHVMGSQNGFSVLHAGVYEQDGLDIDDADFLANSLPLSVGFDLHRSQANPAIFAMDKPMHDALRAVGYQIDDEHGIVELFLTRGGGYYIDVGAAAAIANGSIRIKSGCQVDHFSADGAVFTDGSEAKYDTVILCTGYGNMREVVREVLGDDVAEQCPLAWGVDEGGEVNGMWRRTGHSGLWLMGGNLGLVRHMSRTLALQIKAIEAGLIERSPVAAGASA